jgi:hypothetical protein
MAEGRAIWRSAPSAALVAIGVLTACSHDPIAPAPVFMMGGNRAADATAPTVAAPRPARAPEMRIATAAPAPAAKHVTPGQHGSSRAIVAKHPARTHKAARARLTTRHVTAAPSRTKVYAASGIAARPAAGKEMVRLDSPQASTPGPAAAMPPGSAAPSEQTAPSWASPAAPAETRQSQFRPPVP